MGKGTGTRDGLESQDRSIVQAAGLARRFSEDQRGVTAVIFGIVFSAILLSAALAIDYTLAVTEMMREQAALDAATLAASDRLGKEDQDTKGPEVAAAFFKANLSKTSDAKIKSINFDATKGTVDAKAGVSLATKMMHLFGYDKVDIATDSSVARGDGTVEVAMVLDNSGSMSGPYIEDLKTAAQELADIVLETEGAGAGKVSIGLIPFAASVNVGAGFANAAWMDAGAQSSIHSENFDENRSRFELFAELGENWSGCVEARPAPYDVNDVAPDPANGDTMFVPMFAPDEPDNVNASNAGYSNYLNNYLSDFGGSCPEPSYTCVRRNSKTGKCKSFAVDPISVEEAQSRTCKYTGATVSGGSGPNYMCTTAPIQSLTTEATTIRDAILGLGANGFTNIAEGVAWGWRVLSPSLPFSEGRAYSDQKNSKILIVMTDGQNVYNARSDHNMSQYGARGYAAKGRLGTTYTSSGYRGVIDDKTLSSCTAAKAEGLTVYTVAFRLENDANTTALLKSCASSKNHFFQASDGDALVQSFQNIGRKISDLRIAG